MALDDDDKKEIAALIAESLKASTAETQKMVSGVVANAMKGLGIDEKLAALKTELTPKEPPDGEKPKGGGVEEDPAFKKLRAELEQQRKATEAQAKRAEEEAKARQAEALTNGVTQALVSAGADPKRVGIALAHLRAQGVVELDEKGAPVFAFSREWGPEKVPAAKGATEWLATEEGKFFVPPVDTRGTGDGAGRPQGGGSGGASGDVNSIIGRALGNVFG